MHENKEPNEHTLIGVIFLSWVCGGVTRISLGLSTHSDGRGKLLKLTSSVIQMLSKVVAGSRYSSII